MKSIFCLTGVYSIVFTATYIADTRYDKLSGNNSFDKFKWNPGDEVRLLFYLQIIVKHFL